MKEPGIPGEFDLLSRNHISLVTYFARYLFVHPKEIQRGFVKDPLRGNLATMVLVATNKVAICPLPETVKLCLEDFVGGKTAA